MDTKLYTHPVINPDVLDELSRLKKDELLAAIDLGSNSFHLAVARLDHGEVRKVLSLSDKVQLAAGLDDKNHLTEEAMARGLACLSRFNEYLAAVPKERIRAVATNALRKAENREVFIERASEVLSVPIEVIAGREEARLIYLGVSHTNASIDKRLVIDIGGGSTEFIIGEGFTPIETESLQMGCVAYTKKFFNDGKITQKAFDNAMKATQTELLTIAKRYKKTGWSHVMGSSGTIKAAYLTIKELGYDEKITLPAMKKLKKYLIDLGDASRIELDSIKPHRTPVFAAGVAELYAIMKVLEIEEMDYSDGALREGVMYDMLGRQDHEDVQLRSVEALAERYSVSQKQAALVTNTALRLFDANAAALGLSLADRDLLIYAAKLHEIGLAVSHSNYHHHTSYLLKHSDMFGFSTSDQLKLAYITLYQRRKLKNEAAFDVVKAGGRTLLALCLLLRLSVMAYQARSRHSASVDLSVTGETWTVTVAEGYQAELIRHQLEADAAQFAKWGVRLVVA